METRENTQGNSKVVDIIQIGLMAAIIFVATSIINVKTFMGVLHAGDSMVFLAAIIFRRNKAVLASAIGMTLFDLTHGYLNWAPFTLVIKGVMAFLAATIAYRKEYNGYSVVNNLLAFIISGIWMIGAYFIGGSIILTFLSEEKQTLAQSLILSLKDVPTNIVQVIVGMLIAFPLINALRKTKFKERM